MMRPRVLFSLVISKIFHPGLPFKRISSCASFSRVQKYLMSITQDCCSLMGMFVMPTAVALSQCIGISGWICLRSLRVSLNIIPSCQFRNKAPSLALAADAMTICRIEHNMWNTPLSLNFPWKNVHMPCCMHSACLNRTRPNGYSW